MSAHHLKFFVAFALLSSACEEPPRPTPQPTQAPQAQPTHAVATPGPNAPAEAPPSAARGGAASTEPGPQRPDAHVKLDYPGPWFIVTARETGVYADTKADRNTKLAWARNGGRLAVLPDVTKSETCSAGWYQLTTGGYVCGKDGAIEVEGKKTRSTLKQPALEDILPYKYARNSKHGTPLYRSIPSPEQMLEYEPYLAEKKANKTAAGKEKTPDADAGTEQIASDAGKLAPTASSATPRTPVPDAGAPEPELELSEAEVSALNDAGVPWWQKDDASVHDVTLDQLEEEGDGILAKRMVAGFYVAVDSVFHWNKRTWYKTTKGMVAPADRFWVTAGPEFKGVELDGTNYALPVAWVYGWRKEAVLYELDEAKDTLKPKGTAKLFQALKLSGRTRSVRGKPYHELAEGLWISDRSIRVTQPGPPPAGLLPTERWVDVDLSQQTLVVFEGTRPVYATLVSTGKSSKIKEKDHSTPIGEWRIREKHITTTMDGDGTAAGDLPYSIEDVPYAMYYYKAFALHGAFWHKNFGTQMSHGCVNLAPLDAKWLFFFTDPPVPHGVHGVWARDNQPGSRVVVHE
ncbi:MAG: L,D-transpeptidase [Polyangiaceae bacterium]|nr:L,D-transpeptidase [Polyangiaceae bacterium]